MAPFEQVQDMTVALKRIILRYDDSQILNELLQNADDAGSREFKLCLDLRQNALVGSIPSEINGLQSALSVYIDNNQLTGRLPYTLGNLSSLEQLQASHNSLGGVIPPSVGNLLSLR